MRKESSLDLVKTSHIIFVDANRVESKLGYNQAMTWYELSVAVDEILRVSTYTHKTRVRDVLARRLNIEDPREG
jgi:hypothetical protein